MLVGLKVQGFYPNIDFGVDGTGFRHPQHGLNNCPTIDDWDDCVWLDGNGVAKPTAQELTDAPYPEAYQRQLAKEAIYAPFTYLGVEYGMTPDRTNVYDSLMGKHSRGKAAKSVVEALDGTFTKFGTPAALKAFLDAVDDELDTRLATAHDGM